MEDISNFDGTGRDFEEAVFGLRSDSECILGFSIFLHAREEALKISKKNGWKPSQIDSSLLIKNLFDDVYTQLLNDYCKEGTFQLEVWPTLDSTFDLFHRIDGLFRFHDKKNKKRKEKGKQRKKHWTYVYFDLSLNAKKKDSDRIMILRFEDFVDEVRRQNVASRIASKLVISMFS